MAILKKEEVETKSCKLEKIIIRTDKGMLRGFLKNITDPKYTCNCNEFYSEMLERHYVLYGQLNSKPLRIAENEVEAIEKLSELIDNRIDCIREWENGEGLRMPPTGILYPKIKRRSDEIKLGIQ